MEIFELESELEQLQKMKDQSDRALDLYIEAVRVRELKIKELEVIVINLKNEIQNLLSAS